MRDLRLTHGGFYRHFASKEELFSEAFAQSLTEVSERVASAADQAQPGKELEALVGAYLSTEHCSNVAGGCPVAALSTELSRHPRSARATFQGALQEHFARMARYLPGGSQEDRERRAAMLFSGMAGTLAMVRATTDPSMRAAVLEEARRFYLKAARA
jgi:TetR/AcrR family transcriptional repressor of nem operon